MRARLILVSLLALAATASAQPPNRAPANSASDRNAISTDAAAAEVLAFERDMEAAVVRGDVAYLSRILASDFTFTHGDGWTTGGAPIRVDTRASWLEAVGKQPYLSRDLDSVKVEMHGDIAITYGRYVAKNRSAAAGRDRFTVWFERVYARRKGQWQYVSHRTVHGPTYQ
ncbi:MAG TPA: nuclear transport factor 2 family protein [Vicinamibacterales bacterium]|jgi:hypothetical protein